MKPWLDMGDCRLYHGDALAVLRNLPSESVHCIVTSPPYWGLRDYGVDGQLGLEESPEAFVERLADVFDEVRRVLRSDGTCWVNLGDSYADRSYTRRGVRTSDWEEKAAMPWRVPSAMGGELGLKEKDLVGAPWMLAFELRRRGWWLRRDVIWAKPNGMPESVKDRPTTSHEYLFLLAKSDRYFYDAVGVSEPATAESIARAARSSRYDDPDTRAAVPYATARPRVGPDGTRQLRSVWTIPTQPTPEAHFATYPERLVEPCILSSTSEHGVCSACGAPWRREVDVTYDDEGRTSNGTKYLDSRHQKGGSAAYEVRRIRRSQTRGWEPTCDCVAPIAPATVLDPFVGSGTTSRVARRLGRHSIGIDLSDEYLTIASRRLAQGSLLTGSPS